jgi:hypothetical protein
MLGSAEQFSSNALHVLRPHLRSRMVHTVLDHGSRYNQ